MINLIHKNILQIITITLISTILHCQTDTLTSSLTSFPADGISGGAVILDKTFWSEDKIIIPNSDSIEIISVEETSNQIKFISRARRKPVKLYFNQIKVCVWN
jgi:hypothetical protein